MTRSLSNERFNIPSSYPQRNADSSAFVSPTTPPHVISIPQDKSFSTGLISRPAAHVPFSFNTGWNSEVRSTSVPRSAGHPRKTEIFFFYTEHLEAWPFRVRPPQYSRKPGANSVHRCTLFKARAFTCSPSSSFLPRPNFSIDF